MHDTDPNMRGNSRRWIVQEVEASLRRLQTDWIDLYQIHRWDPETEHEETLGALTDLQRAGKIRYLGSSTYPPSAIVEAQWVARASAGSRGSSASSRRTRSSRAASRPRCCRSASATAWA